MKGVGYLVSTLSVLLLGMVAWKGASEDPGMMLALVGGMAASVVGMMLRWASHARQKREKQAPTLSRS